MNGYYPSDWVVLYNPGQFVRRQQRYFSNRQDAEKWLVEWRKRNPRGSSSFHPYNNNDHTILVHDDWSGSARWEPME